MKIRKDCKIELIASNNRTRLCLAQPYLEGDSLVATNGRCLVMLPVVREDGDEDGRISAQALAAARKLVKHSGEISIHANGAQVLADGTSLPRATLESHGKFPNWKQVVPKLTEISHPHRITLNAKYLYEIAQAMGAEAITLSIQDENSAAVITSSANPGAIGVLMPVRTR